MGICLVALLAFGGTYAYFTASANSKKATVTTGIVALTSGAKVETTITGAVTGTPVLGDVVYSIGTTDVRSFAFVKMVVTSADGVTAKDLFGSDITVNAAWTKLTGVEGVDDVWYQEYKETEGDTFAGAFISALTVTASPNWVEGESQPKAMGANFTISLTGQSVQAYKSGAQGSEVYHTAAEAYALLTWN